MNYEQFLKNKIIISEEFGFEPQELSPKLHLHQPAIVEWALKGGRRAIFASFGLGKTFMQLEIARQCILKEKKPFLIVCPLGVVGEFKRDNSKLQTGFEIEYITDTNEIENYENKIYVTNYERVRKGDIDPSKFSGVSFDEASILRNLKTETTNYVLEHFRKVPYRFVATATPTPNDYIEILNYAEYLGVADRGHLLTRFFKRDSQKAGNLKLLENKKDEFWKWVATWAVFITKPHDLGFPDEGYDLPPLNIIEHRLDLTTDEFSTNKFGKLQFFKDTTKSLVDVSREKRDSISDRLNEVEKILKTFKNDGRKEGLSKGLLREKQGTTSDKTADSEQEELRGKHRISPQEKQEMGGREPRENEGSSTKASENGELEGISQNSLSKQFGKSSKSNENITAKTLRDDTGNISADVGFSKWAVQNLQPDSEGSIEEPERGFSSRSLPQDRQSPGTSLSSLQCCAGAISGQSRNFEKGDRLPSQLIIWCDLNSEQIAIEKLLKSLNISFVSLTGGETALSRENKMESWRNGEVDIFLSKTSMYGSGINMQQASEMIYAGITYKFQDFFQGIHRCYRFGQTKPVNVHIIYTNNEDEVFAALMRKWEQHKELQAEMIALVKEYGLNSDLIKSQMERQIFKSGKKIIIGDATLYNNDTTLVHADRNEMPDDSVGMILTSIPFGDHYEYSDNYNDFGHNDGNDNFFKQMDYLTPNLLRVLKPGRVAAIHVKDRPRYSHQTDVQFFTIDPFSDNTVAHFRKHGFYYMGRITVTTDVVQENNQTYRLGWGEQRKDASKMGVGIPEYILLFRKKPSHTKNAYADDPVTKDIQDYLLSLWQLDAHSYWKSSGNRFLTSEELKKFDMGKIYRAWQKHNSESIYDFKEHLKISEDLDEMGKLSKLFMTLPPVSNQDMVWTDISRLRTLNAKQVSNKKEKHICPLQLDIIERLINRFTNPGDLVDDPFGGLFSTAYMALDMKRKAISIELNSEYFADGVDYVNAINYKINMPTLFDFIGEPELEKTT